MVAVLSEFSPRLTEHWAIRWWTQNMPTGLSLVSIDELREKTKQRTGDVLKEHARGTGRVVAVAEHRDGTVIDLIEGIDG